MKKKKHSFQSIASAIAKQEKGKSESNIGDTRESLSKLCQMMAKDAELVATLIQIGVNKNAKK